MKGPVHLWGPVYSVTCQRLHGNLGGPKKVKVSKIDTLKRVLTITKEDFCTDMTKNLGRNKKM